MSGTPVTVVEQSTDVAVIENPIVVVSVPGAPADPIGTAGALVAAHEAATDPHPLYLNEARAAALYAPVVHVHGMGDITGLAAALAAKADVSALAAKVDASSINAANGVAGLDAVGKLNPSTLPALAITDTYLVSSQAAMLATDADVGDVAIRSDINKTFILRATPATTLTNWSEVLAPTAAVSSVFGRTGAVTAQAGDYSFAQIGSKPTTVAGYGITDAWHTGNFDPAEKLDASSVSTSNIANTVVARNSSGDIVGRLLRTEYGDEATMSGAIAFRINNTTNNYTRYCSSPTAVRGWLGAAAAADPTFTGNSVFNGGVSFGTTVAPGGPTDLSRHITLAGSTYGFSYTANRLNYCAGNAAAHDFFLAGSSVFTVDATQLYAGGKAAIRYNDTWLRLNPNNDFASGTYGGTGLFRHDGILQVGTSNTNGFYTSPSTAPQWKSQELGYRSLNFNTRNANYTLVAEDAGKSILHSNASNYTYTVPAVFSAGDIVTIISSSTGTLTLVGSGVSLYPAPGSGAPGNRVLSERAVATLLFLNANTALVFGIGVA